jgi:ACT domain
VLLCWAFQVIGADGTALGVLNDSHTLSVEVLPEYDALRMPSHVIPPVCCADACSCAFSIEAGSLAACCALSRCAAAADACCCLVTKVADTAGSLADITLVIASHGINVQSLAVGSSEQPGRSRITVVVPRDDAGLASLVEKACTPCAAAPLTLTLISAATMAGSGALVLQIQGAKHNAVGHICSTIGDGTAEAAFILPSYLQVEALPIVGRVTDLTEKPFVARELMIVKVHRNSIAASKYTSYS